MKTGLQFDITARCLATVAALAVSFSASASSVVIQGDSAGSTEGLGDFSGLVSYAFDAGLDVGVLVIELTNTTDPATGGYITAFLFNINSADPLASADLVGSTKPSFSEITNGNGNPFGTFDSGAGLGGQFQGGPIPDGGISIGSTESFTFHISATDASSLTATSFLTGPNQHNFVVRFRGMDDNGSDKVPVRIIPLPAAVWMGLAGLGIVAAARRRLLRAS